MHLRVSRTPVREIKERDVESLGASYTHLSSLKGVVGVSTRKVVAYHSFLSSLEGFEDAASVDIAYLGFNRIEKFREIDKTLKIGVLDLSGNPLTSLFNCPPCRELIVSATRLRDLTGAPEGVEILRCGHSVFLESLKGCPSSVKLIECSCSPNLMVNQEHLPVGIQEVLGDSSGT